MSTVTNVIISFSVMENTNLSGNHIIMTEIDNWLYLHEYGTFANDLSDIVGGNKTFETPLYAAAFNNFNIELFLTMLKSKPWKEPEFLQVFIQEEEEEFTIHTFKPSYNDLLSLLREAQEHVLDEEYARGKCDPEIEVGDLGNRIQAVIDYHEPPEEEVA